jgi:hypothetical protein
MLSAWSNIEAPSHGRTTWPTLSVSTNGPDGSTSGVGSNPDASVCQILKSSGVRESGRLCARSARRQCEFAKARLNIPEVNIRRLRCRQDSTREESSYSYGVSSFPLNLRDQNKVKTIPLILIACAVITAPALAFAKTGRCLLEVNRKAYLDGPCEVKIEKGGTFTIGVSDKHPLKYFAYVLMDDDGAHGYWNEEPGATHAHSELGILKRDGACWVNDTARVCAW